MQPVLRRGAAGGAVHLGLRRRRRQGQQQPRRRRCRLHCQTAPRPIAGVQMRAWQPAGSSALQIFAGASQQRSPPQPDRGSQRGPAEGRQRYPGTSVAALPAVLVTTGITAGRAALVGVSKYHNLCLLLMTLLAVWWAVLGRRLPSMAVVSPCRASSVFSGPLWGHRMSTSSRRDSPGIAALQWSDCQKKNCSVSVR